MRRVANIEISDELLAEVGGIEQFIAMLPKSTVAVGLRVDRMRAQTVVQVEHPDLKPVLAGAAIPFVLPAFHQGGDQAEFVDWGQGPRGHVKVQEWFK